MHTPVRIGLTGGIGSGKSTVAQILADLGAAVIDADAISRSLTLAGGLAMPEVLAAFGADMVLPDGAMNRQAMRTKVFAHPDSKRQLEAIIHPWVARLIQEKAQHAAESGKKCIVYDIPLLVESIARWRGQLDQIWVVDCAPDTQVQRVVARSGLTPAEVAQIMAQQATREQRLACADVVIYNQDLDLAGLKRLVHEKAADCGL